MHVNYSDHFCSDRSHCLFVHQYLYGCCVITVYKSPKFSVNKFLLKLETILKSCLQNTIFVGDFNIGVDGTSGKDLLQLFHRFRFNSLLDMKSPSTDNGTHIDHCFSNFLWTNSMVLWILLQLSQSNMHYLAEKVNRLNQLLTTTNKLCVSNLSDEIKSFRANFYQIKIWLLKYLLRS